MDVEVYKGILVENWVMGMVEVNRRLKALHSVFCKTRCKFYKRGKCTDTLKKATLETCPVGEWWDLNDWINQMEIVIGKIQRQYSKKHVVDKKGKLSDLG